MREFQIYASMPTSPARVARSPRAARRCAAEPRHHAGAGSNDQPYSGPASGALNAETRALLKMWVERDWHCPVVVEARVLTPPRSRPAAQPEASASGGRRSRRGDNAAHHNIWRRDQLANQAVHFIAWDFTDHYPQAAGPQPRRPGRRLQMTVPTFGVAPTRRRRTAPGARRRSGRTTCSARRRIRLAGRPEGVLVDLPRRRRGRRGRVVGRPRRHERVGLGDRVGRTLSLDARPRQKLVGGGAQNIPDDCVVYRGELCPAMSTWRRTRRPSSRSSSGTSASGRWSPGPTRRSPCTPRRHRKYRGWILLQDGMANWVDPRKRQARDGTAGTGRRSSHATSSSQRSCTTGTGSTAGRWQGGSARGCARSMWNLARARIRALLATPWPGQAWTVGDVFTSEMAVAMLERIHVFSPPRVNERGVDGPQRRMVGLQTGANINAQQPRQGVQRRRRTGSN